MSAWKCEISFLFSKSYSLTAIKLENNLLPELLSQYDLLSVEIMGKVQLLRGYGHI